MENRKRNEHWNKRGFCILSALIAVCACCFLLGSSCVQEPQQAPAEPSAADVSSADERSAQDIIEDICVFYGSYGSEADANIEKLLGELDSKDHGLAVRWKKIMELWRTDGAAPELNYDVLPDGLCDTDELCIVVLGFQLEPDGTMREELIQRLGVVLRSAEKYPNAYVVCTGGGTASENPSATEAGRMAQWLIANGVDSSRVIVEDKSLTTAQNAIYTFDILREKYPRVSQLAIVSSDYHIATGVLLFGAESLLRAEQPGNETVSIVSNAAYKAPSGTLSTMFQAGALIELSGDTETAFDIYYDTYDIHELPKME